MGYVFIGSLTSRLTDFRACAAEWKGNTPWLFWVSPFFDFRVFVVRLLDIGDRKKQTRLPPAFSMRTLCARYATDGPRRVIIKLRTDRLFSLAQVIHRFYCLQFAFEIVLPLIQVPARRDTVVLKPIEQDSRTDMDTVLTTQLDRVFEIVGNGISLIFRVTCAIGNQPSKLFAWNTNGFGKFGQLCNQLTPRLCLHRFIEEPYKRVSALQKASAKAYSCWCANRASEKG